MPGRIRLEVAPVPVVRRLPLSSLPLLVLALLAPLAAGATPVTWVWTVSAGTVSDSSGTGLIASGESFEIEVELDPATSFGTGQPSSLLYPASRFEIRLPGATLLGPEPGTHGFQSLLLLVADGSAQFFFGQPGDALAIVSGPTILGGTPFHFAGGGTGLIGPDLGVALLDPTAQVLSNTGIPVPPPPLSALQNTPASVLGFSWTDGSGSHSILLDDLVVTSFVALPEPGVLALLGAAVSGALLSFRRSRRRRGR